MTAPKTQIQALINKIDEVLNASDVPRASSQPSDEGAQQQLLEQARHYLASLQGTSALSAVSGSSPHTPSLPDVPNVQDAALPTYLGTSAAGGPAESAQQVLQAVVQEMNYLRVNMMQPLREELMTLYQQRQLLMADIQRLEQQRHQLLLSQQQFDQQKVIQNFLQSLMERLQEQLVVQIAQTYTNLELQASQLPSSEEVAGQPQLTPGQRLQHMQSLQAQSDEMMLKLDSTLRVVFDSLQTNIESYQESLGQGLEKMHSLGQQGEAVFAALVNRFAEQLGRGASYYLQSSMRKEWELPGLGTVEGPDGSIPSQQPVQSEDEVTVPDKLPDDQLNRMIGSLDVIDEEASHSSTETDETNNENLLDELLETFGADSSTVSEGIDFNLDDLSLPEDDATLDDLSDRPSSEEDTLTLFELEHEGVQEHFEDDQITQIQDADADSFLEEISSLTSNNEETVLMDALDNASPESDDEAIAFLNQVATEMEQNLDTAIQGHADNMSSEITPSEEQPELPHVSDIASQRNLVEETLNVVPDEATPPNAGVGTTEHRTPEPPGSDSNPPEAESPLDSSEDEIDEFYRMFDTASDLSQPNEPQPSGVDTTESMPVFDTEASPSTTAPPTPGRDASLDNTNASLLESPSLADVEHPPSAAPIANSPMNEAVDSSLESLSVETLVERGHEDDAPGLLADLFDDSLAPAEAKSIQQPETEMPTSANSEDDLFAELGLSPLKTADEDKVDDSDQVETISSLADLVNDTTARASIEAISGGSGVASTRDASSSGGIDADQYIVASPDEDLLAADELDSRGDQTLPLDEKQRQRLASDLANLEGLDTSEVLSNFEFDLPPLDDEEISSLDSLGEGEETEASRESFSVGSHTEQEGDSLEDFLSLDDAFLGHENTPSDTPSPLETSDEAAAVQSGLELPDTSFSPDVSDRSDREDMGDAQETGDRSITLGGFANELDESSAEPASITIADLPVVNEPANEPASEPLQEPSSEPTRETFEDVQNPFADFFGDEFDDEPAPTPPPASPEHSFADFFGDESDDELTPESPLSSMDFERGSEDNPTEDSDADNNAEDSDDIDFLSGLTPLASEPTDSELWNEPDLSASENASLPLPDSIETTVDNLFGEASQSAETDTVGGDRPDGYPTDLFNVDDELQGIFEDLKALDSSETETSQNHEEQTLLDLMKGLSQPTVPDDDPKSGGSAETDTSWSIFDDVNDPQNNSGSDQTKA